MGQVLRANGINRTAPAISVAGSGTSVRAKLVAARSDFVFCLPSAFKLVEAGVMASSYLGSSL